VLGSVQKLRQVDRLEILVIVDNYVDLGLAADKWVERPSLAHEIKKPGQTLLAEHGLCLLVTCFSGNRSHSILLDSGRSTTATPSNMTYLKVDLNQVEAIVISHGHADHTGALAKTIEAIPGRVDLIAHPDAFLNPRFFDRPDGTRITMPPVPGRTELDRLGANLIENEGPLLLADETILATGQIPRITSFEKRLIDSLGAYCVRDGQVVPDSINDDQALVIKLNNGGLVVISGCAHAGIINTVLYAQELTGVTQIKAILGGFHLTGAGKDKVIEATVTKLKTLGPEKIVPMHCTGQKAVCRFASEMSESFITSSLGTRFILTACE